MDASKRPSAGGVAMRRRQRRLRSWWRHEQPSVAAALAAATHHSAPRSGWPEQHYAPRGTDDRQKDGGGGPRGVLRP